MAMQFLMVPSASIPPANACDSQMRTEEDDHISEKVKEYYESLVAFRRQSEDPDAVPWPPIVGFYDKQKDLFPLGDGWQRLGAHRRAGDKMIPMIVHDPSFKDETCPYRAAIRMGCSANAHPNSVRSNAAKRRAIEKHLRDEVWGTWSDRRIARECNASHPLVAQVRSELEEAGEIRVRSPRSAPAHDPNDEFDGSQVEELPLDPESVADSEVSEDDSNPWDIVDDDDSEPSQGSDNAGPGEDYEPPADRPAAVPAGDNSVFDQKMRDYNEPFLKMRKDVRHARKRLQETFDRLTVDQFPSARFQALDNALKAVDDAVAPCIATGLCTACGGKGCEACKKLGWLNSIQKKQQERAES